MPFKVFTNGSILPDTDINDYLMEQVIVTCTSGTHPASPGEGWHVYETDTDRLAKYTGSAWEYVASSRVSYTPTLSAVTTPPTMGTGAIRQGHYSILPGPTCYYTFFVQFGTSGVAAGSGQYLMSLPFNASAAQISSGQPAIGTAMMRDNSAGTVQPGVCYVPSSNLAVVAFYIGTASTNDASPWVWAASDYIAGSITYPI